MKFQLCLLGHGDAFLYNGVKYEKAEEWTVDIPKSIECVNMEELKYVDLDPYVMVEPISE